MNLTFRSKLLLGIAAWCALAVLMILPIQAGAASVCSPPVGTTGLINVSPAANFSIEQRTMHCASNTKESLGQRDSCYRRFVNDDGVWLDCNRWVPDGGDPRMQEPQAACDAEPTYKHWGGEDQQLCSSVPPGAVISGAEMLMLPKAAHNVTHMIRDPWPPATGLQVYRCERGVWRKLFETCGYEEAAPVTEPQPRGRARQGDAKVGPVQIKPFIPPTK